MTDSTLIALTDVFAYLRADGWSLHETKGAWRTFEKDIDGESVGLEVPATSDARSYEASINRLLRDLELIEDRPTNQIEKDVRSSSFDVVRLRLVGALHNGRIPVESGAKAFHAARDLMLAAACSTLLPTRSMFTRRKPDKAMDYLRSAKFAPSEAGSFIISIESPIPPKLRPSQADLFDSSDGQSLDRDPQPFERAVGLRLASGVSASRSLVDEIAADESSDLVLRSIERGVTSNLCDAIAQFVATDIAERVEIGVRWSGLRPSPIRPATTTFHREHHAALRAISATLRDVGVFDDCEVFGPVRKLNSEDLDLGGTIQLIMMDEPARLRKVSIALASAAYKMALEAHADNRWFTCVGELHYHKGAYYLTNARAPGIVAEPGDAAPDAEASF